MIPVARNIHVELCSHCLAKQIFIGKTQNSYIYQKKTHKNIERQKKTNKRRNN